jgi:hypothetical protein
MSDFCSSNEQLDPDVAAIRPVEGPFFLVFPTT